MGLPFMNKAKEVPGADEPAPSTGYPVQSTVLSAFAKDTTPAADAIRSLLEDPTPERAQALLEQLPALIPDDPALAAVIAEEMAKQFGETVANKTDENGMEHGEAGSGNGGQFVSQDGGSSETSLEGEVGVKSKRVATDDEVKSFLEGPVQDTDVELVDALLTRGFEVKDASGNMLHFGQRMKKHLEDHGQGESDRRKRRLRHGVELVKNTEPVISVRDANVSCYFGKVNGKGYLLMADNSGEVYEVWDEFRRDSWKNEKKKGASGGQPADAT